VQLLYLTMNIILVLMLENTVNWRLLMRNCLSRRSKSVKLVIRSMILDCLTAKSNQSIIDFSRWWSEKKWSHF